MPLYIYKMKEQVEMTETAPDLRGIKITMERCVESTKKDIAEMEARLAIPVLEDSHALILTDSSREGEVRVYGSWKDGSLGGAEVRGFKHIQVLPWHICGTFGYPAARAAINVKKLQAAEQSPTVTYSYIHFRQLREMVLARLKESVRVGEEMLAKLAEKM